LGDSFLVWMMDLGDRRLPSGEERTGGGVGHVIHNHVIILAVVSRIERSYQNALRSCPAL
jgi:hypothetical protein